MRALRDCAQHCGQQFSAECATVHNFLQRNKGAELVLLARKEA